MSEERTVLYGEILSRKDEIISMLRELSKELIRNRGSLFSYVVNNKPSDCKMCAQGMILDLIHKRNIHNSSISIMGEKISLMGTPKENPERLEDITPNDYILINFEFNGKTFSFDNGNSLEEDVCPPLNLSDHKEEIIEKKGEEFYEKLCHSVYPQSYFPHFNEFIIPISAMNDEVELDKYGEPTGKYIYSLSDIADLIEICWE